MIKSMAPGIPPWAHGPAVLSSCDTSPLWASSSNGGSGPQRPVLVWASEETQPAEQLAPYVAVMKADVIMTLLPH